MSGIRGQLVSRRRCEFKPSVAGRGIVATAKIPRGTLITSEAPVVSTSTGRDIAGFLGQYKALPSEIQRCIRLLPPRPYIERSLQRDFEWLALVGASCSTEDELQAFSSFRSNSVLAPESIEGMYSTIRRPEDDHKRHYLFLSTSMMNLACTPNAQETWNENTGFQNVYATHDIEVGQHITVGGYYSIFDPEVRREVFVSQTIPWNGRWKSVKSRDVSQRVLGPAMRRLLIIRCEQEDLQGANCQCNECSDSIYSPSLYMRAITTQWVLQDNGHLFLCDCEPRWWVVLIARIAIRQQHTSAEYS